jgi:hypothetical protein
MLNHLCYTVKITNIFNKRFNMRKPFFQTLLLPLALAFLSLPIFGQNGACDYDNTPPQFTYCPSNIVVQSFNGGAIVAWRTPLATDNCTTPTVYNSSYRESGSFFYAGESEVSYTAVDARYNSARCTFKVRVNNVCAGDTVRPTITNCPKDIVVISTDSCAIVRWTEPKITDNCGIPYVNVYRRSGTCFPLGTTPVIYTAYDAGYNTTSCQFSVVVSNTPCDVDTIKPVISNCPANISTVVLDSCPRLYWQAPTAVDNCSVPTLVASHQPFTCFEVGTTPVTYTFTDTKGNSSVCRFTVTLDNPCLYDTVKPTIFCPENIVRNTTDSVAYIYWYPPYAYDNCRLDSVVVNREAGYFGVGTTLVTGTATDRRGNQSTCTFRITVNQVESLDPCFRDTTKPVLSNCPENKVVWTYDSSIFVSLPRVEAYDNCTYNVSLLSSHPFGGFFPIGVTNVTNSATDNAGNRTTCSATITVKQYVATDTCQIDSIAPDIYGCPISFVHQTLDSCTTVYWDFPIFTDNCGTPSVTATHRSGTCFKEGVTEVIYKATDGKGNQSICKFTVTIDNPCSRDTVKPVFYSCPQNIVTTTFDSCVRPYWYVPDTYDNCSTPTVVASHRPYDCFSIGNTTVTYTATDGNRNQTVCAFSVTVIDQCAGDTIKPYFQSCPQNFVRTTLDTCAYVDWYGVYAYDNCGTPSVTSNYQPFSCFPLGATKVTITATDSKNNKAVCEFTVTVIDLCFGDTIKPYFQNCPQNLILTSADTVAYAYWNEPIAYDNCVSYPITTRSHYPYSPFPLGTTNVVYTATDSKKNKGYCTFKVIVNNPCANDSIKPVLKNCPANIVLTTNDSCAIANWTAPTATDNCTTPSVLSTHQAGTCFKGGTTAVIYTAKDARNNTASCTFTVTVNNPCFRDTIKPVIKNCPANILLTSADSCSIARWTTPTATDNCTATPSVIGTHQSGICFPIGSTTVSYVATDAKSNKTYCTFKVTVSNPCFIDTIKPTIYNCPASITKETLDSTLAVTWKAPIAIDNCSMPTLTATKQPNALFNIGTTTVVYTASDSKNNKSTCTFTVTVKRIITPCSNDTVKPVFTTCPANITVTTTATTAMAQWTAPTATDNCSTPSVSGTFGMGASFPTGTTAVVYTAKDTKNNVNYCRFNVTIVTNRTSLILDSTKCYALVARSSKKAITIANASTVTGAYAVQWSYLNTLNQKWKISAADTNSFNLTGRHSNLNLDTRWGATTEGARLMQWSKSATAATQKWQFTLLADGYYKVVNKGSRRALSVSGGAGVTADGGMLIQSNYTGLTSQQWTISEVPCTSTTANFATNDVLDMEAYPEFNRARIEWTDNTGYKNDYYEIQKLNPQSGEFERIDVMNNMSFSNTPSYQLAYDKSPMDGDNFYRVKAVYLDSLSKLSPIKKLAFNGLETIKLFPNPANDYVDIDLSKFGNETIGVYLYNNFGVQVAFKTVKKDKFNVVHFDISNQQNGSYLMRIVAQGKRDVLRQLQIVK